MKVEKISKFNYKYLKFKRWLSNKFIKPIPPELIAQRSHHFFMKPLDKKVVLSDKGFEYKK